MMMGMSRIGNGGGGNGGKKIGKVNTRNAISTTMATFILTPQPSP